MTSGRRALGRDSIICVRFPVGRRSTKIELEGVLSLRFTADSDRCFSQGEGCSANAGPEVVHRGACSKSPIFSLFSRVDARLSNLGPVDAWVLRDPLRSKRSHTRRTEGGWRYAGTRAAQVVAPVEWR